MAFPTTAILDNFNRANAGPPPSASWTGIYGAGLGVISNALSKTASGDTSGILWTASTFGPNSECYYTIASAGASQAYGKIYIRIDAGVTGGYALAWGAFTSEISINVVASGTLTAIGATISQAITDGDSLGIEVVGSTLVAYHKPVSGSWTAIGTRSDSTWTTAGRIGLDMYADTGTAVSFDDFGGGTYVPPAATNRNFMTTRSKFWGG